MYLVLAPKVVERVTDALRCMQQASGCKRVDPVLEMMLLANTTQEYPNSNTSLFIPYTYSTGDMIGPGESLYVQPCTTICCNLANATFGYSNEYLGTQRTDS